MVTSEKPQPKIERVKLTITEAKEPVAVGDKGALKKAFTAKREGTDKAVSYFTFSKSLFEKVLAGASIDADVETSTREYDGNTYTDRKVSQIYEGGQPVAQHGTGAGSGGQRAWGKSPETLALEHKNEMEIEILTHGSIEKQVAVKELGEGLRSGLFKPDSAEMGIYREAIWGMLQSKSPTPSTNPSKPVLVSSGPPLEALWPEDESLLRGTQSEPVKISKETLSRLIANIKRVGEEKWLPLVLQQCRAEKLEDMFEAQGNSANAQLAKVKAK